MPRPKKCYPSSRSKLLPILPAGQALALAESADQRNPAQMPLERSGESQCGLSELDDCVRNEVA